MTAKAKKKYEPGEDAGGAKPREITAEEYLAPYAGKLYDLERDRRPVDYFLWLFEVPETMKPTRFKEVTYKFDLQWAQHMRYLIGRYHQLKSPARRFVRAAREDGVCWRGEPIGMFKRVVEETMRYRAMTDADRKQYRFAALRGALGEKAAKKATEQRGAA